MKQSLDLSKSKKKAAQPKPQTKKVSSPRKVDQKQSNQRQSSDNRKSLRESYKQKYKIEIEGNKVPNTPLVQIYPYEALLVHNPDPFKN